MVSFLLLSQAEPSFFGKPTERDRKPDDAERPEQKASHEPGKRIIHGARDPASFQRTLMLGLFRRPPWVTPSSDIGIALRAPPPGSTAFGQRLPRQRSR